MKYSTGTVIALAGISNAFPHPQFNLPAFTVSSFSLPTGSAGTGNTIGTGTGTGSGFSWINFIGGGSGFGSGFGSGTATATTTAAATAPVQTGTNTGGTGTIGSNCTPQSAGTSTENGVLNKNCCTDMTIIFARGTTEMGNVGSVAGPPMFKSIRSKLGSNRVTVQGVDYPADFAGNANSGGTGGKTMANLVTQALSQCPNTKIILSGYSQGAMVVHNAFRNGLTASKISGAVLFGDPYKTQAVGDLSSSKVKQFCGTADQICGGGGDGGATGSHLDYRNSADAAATFAIQAAGLS